MRAHGMRAQTPPIHCDLCRQPEILEHGSMAVTTTPEPFYEPGAHENPRVCPHCGGQQIRRETDLFDAEATIPRCGTCGWGPP